mmetsp:Transcript_29672/g.60599  ORF Transcript_29672/g.60599 Transcript_29672/m.60599 type:complete len:130 (+) Transcript_29672:1150-1539(+)
MVASGAERAFPTVVLRSIVIPNMDRRRTDERTNEGFAWRAVLARGIADAKEHQLPPMQPGAKMEAAERCTDGEEGRNPGTAIFPGLVGYADLSLGALRILHGKILLGENETAGFPNNAMENMRTRKTCK